MGLRRRGEGVRKPESGDRGGVTPDKGAAEAQITLGPRKHLDFSLRATDTGGCQAGAGGIPRSGVLETSLIFNEWIALERQEQMWGASH